MSGQCRRRRHRAGRDHLTSSKHMETRSTIAILIGVLALATGCSSEHVAQTSSALDRISLLDSWVEQAVVPPENPGSFGSGIAANGTSLAVGSATYNGTGAVFFQTLATSQWTSGAPLLPERSDNITNYGTTIALSPNFAAVAGQDAGVGSVWTYDLESGSLPTSDMIIASPSSGDQTLFGAALAMSESISDGVAQSTLLIGSPKVNNYQGTAYVYVHTVGTAGWTLQQELLISGPNADGALFGSAVTLQGDVAVIGAPYQGPTGAVHEFDRTGTTWTEQQPIEVPDTAAAFGCSVSVLGDTLAVGATDEGFLVGAASDSTGAAYTYRRAANGWGSITRVHAQAGQAGDYFGTALALSPTQLFVSAPGEAVGGVSSGGVHVFDTEQWTEQGQLFASESVDAMTFGAAIALSSPATLLVSASPTAYVFARPLGVECDSDDNCESGHCADAVCCDTACEGACYSCLGSGHTQTGSGNGVCQRADSGSNPRVGCQSSGTPCGLTGVCDALGACAFANSGATCQEAACTSASSSVDVSLCDGTGKCVTPEETPCGPYVCQKGACAKPCSSNAECDSAAGFYCFSGACVRGARCSEDSKSAYDDRGNQSDCFPMLCQGVACLRQCSVTADCAVGRTCQDGACAPSCNDGTDCDVSSGLYCFSGACVGGIRCSSDATSAYDASGVVTPCFPAQCRNGTCLQECTNSASDCAELEVCDPVTHNCVDETQFESKPNAGGCSMGRPSPFNNNTLASCLVLGLCVSIGRARYRRRGLAPVDI
jgi:hypothetical protein